MRHKNGMAVTGYEMKWTFNVRFNTCGLAILNNLLSMYFTNICSNNKTNSTETRVWELTFGELSIAIECIYLETMEWEWRNDILL